MSSWGKYIIVKGRSVGKSEAMSRIMRGYDCLAKSCEPWSTRGIGDMIRYPAGRLKPLPRALAKVLALWRDAPSCAGSCDQGRQPCNCRKPKQ